jgi:hypothetical protein
MKRLHYLITTIILLTLVSFKTDKSKGVQFITNGWGNIVKESKASGKPIFIFIRTQTCHTSKKMDVVFQNEGLAKVLMDNFVCGELDPDNTIDNLRVTAWGATAVPTYAFLNQKRKLVAITNGYKDPKAMVQLVQEAIAKLDGTSPAN